MGGGSKACLEEGRAGGHYTAMQSYSTLPTTTTLSSLFGHTVLLQYLHLVFDFSCNIRVYEPYLIILNLGRGPKPIMVFVCLWFMCDAAVFRTTSLQNVSDTGYCQMYRLLLFCCFCFVVVFIGVLLKLFSTALHFYLWSVYCGRCGFVG